MYCIVHVVHVLCVYSVIVYVIGVCLFYVVCFYETQFAAIPLDYALCVCACVCLSLLYYKRQSQSDFKLKYLRQL